MSLSPAPRIYLSPHLDDAVWSCGGAIHQRALEGGAVTVVTAMAGDPPAGPLSSLARALHRAWRLEPGDVGTRRAEDARACAWVGAASLGWAIPDALYRRDADGRPLYPSGRSLFGDPHPADAPLVEALAARIAELPAEAEVVAPLALGGHVDHRLLRAAAEQVRGEGLSYYEELPYAGRAAPPSEAAGWRCERISLGEADLRAWIEACACYPSQWGAFWPTPAALEEAVRAFAQGGARLWRRPPPARRGEPGIADRVASSPEEGGRPQEGAGALT